MFQEKGGRNEPKAACFFACILADAIRVPASEVVFRVLFCLRTWTVSQEKEPLANVMHAPHPDLILSPTLSVLSLSVLSVLFQVHAFLIAPPPPPQPPANTSSSSTPPPQKPKQKNSQTNDKNDSPSRHQGGRRAGGRGSHGLGRGQEAEGRCVRGGVEGREEGREGKEGDCSGTDDR